ncbi:hypothetical protein M5689_001669 [Euphorbia peplus]|nr:hypothetical protein M5689_001669 [Euphorbia peplus]
MVTNDLNPEELKHQVMEDYDDSEEHRLSFSDLPFNNPFSSSREHETSSFEQDNLFEFFSEDFTASSANHYPSNDIIFCGKLIPPRNHVKLKSNSFSAEQVDQHEKRFKSCRSFPVINGDYRSSKRPERYDVLRSKRSRWSILFGSIPMEMKLRDIKRRQNKRKPATIFRSGDDDDKNEMMVKNVRSKKLKGLWGLLRVFAFAN